MAVIDSDIQMQMTDTLAFPRIVVLFSQVELLDNPQIPFEDQENGIHQVVVWSCERLMIDTKSCAITYPFIGMCRIETICRKNDEEN